MNKDTITGILMAIFGAGLVYSSQEFPLLAGIPYGPWLFPTITGVGLIICATIIGITGILQLKQAAVNAEQSTHETSKPLNPAALRNALAIIIGVVFFALGFKPLGFHITAFTLEFGLLLFFGVHWFKSLLLALSLTLLVHAIFYSILHVPLPWGLLTAIAW